MGVKRGQGAQACCWGAPGGGEVGHSRWQCGCSCRTLPSGRTLEKHRVTGDRWEESVVERRGAWSTGGGRSRLPGVPPRHPSSLAGRLRHTAQCLPGHRGRQPGRGGEPDVGPEGQGRGAEAPEDVQVSGSHPAGGTCRAPPAPGKGLPGEQRPNHCGRWPSL